MNKKALTQEQIIKGLMAAVLITIVISMFYAPAGSLFARIFGINLTKYIQFGGNQVSKLETQFPEDIQAVYSNLAAAFKQKGSDCLIYIPAIKADFSSYRIDFQSAPDGTWILVNRVESGRAVELKSEKIQGAKLCAISGPIAPTTFYKIKIESQIKFSECVANLRKTKPDISEDVASGLCRPQIEPNMYNTNFEFLSLTGNNRLDTLGLSTVNYNNQEVNLLYKPVEDVVCFMPTYGGFLTKYGCDASDKGLDDDCLKELLPGGKYNLVDSQGKPSTPFCSGEEVLCNIYKRCQDITNLDICKSIGNKCELKCQVNPATQRYCEPYDPLGTKT